MQREKQKRTKLFFCRSGEKLDRFIIFGAILIGLTGYFSRRKLPDWPSRPTAADSARSNFLLPLKNYLWVWPTLVFFCRWRFSVSGSTIDLFSDLRFLLFRKKWTDWSNFYRTTNLNGWGAVSTSNFVTYDYWAWSINLHSLTLKN